MPLNSDSYVEKLPEVETARMPKGTVFYANRQLYEVVEVSTSGFSRARQWRRDEKTDVALVPGSFLTRTLPLVAKGRMLPVYRTRTELADNGKVRGFIFPTEMLARDAAYIDCALILSGGAYVRNHNQEPAFAVTDGVQIFRLYYYVTSDHGRPTHMIGNIVENPRCELRPHTEGSEYWRLLPSWKENFPAAKQTILAMPAVKLPEPDTKEKKEKDTPKEKSPSEPTREISARDIRKAAQEDAAKKTTIAIPKVSPSELIRKEEPTVESGLQSNAQSESQSNSQNVGYHNLSSAVTQPMKAVRKEDLEFEYDPSEVTIPTRPVRLDALTKQPKKQEKTATDEVTATPAEVPVDDTHPNLTL